MKKQKTISFLLLVLTVLLMGIVYAAISNVTFNVSGNVVATGSQSNFKVAIDNMPTISGEGKTKVEILDDTTATIDVSELTKIEDTSIVTFNISNSSADLNAVLTTSVSNSNTEFFTVTETLATNKLGPSESTTLEIRIKLNKTVISDEEKAKIIVSITVNPSYT